MSPIRVTFWLLAIVFATSATPENNIVTMLTSNEGVYKTTVIWKIENFLEMPYAKTRLNKQGGPFFKSGPFPAQSANGVKWHFYLERNGSETLVSRDNDTSINLMLIFKPPQNIAAFVGSCRCGILSVNGTGICEVTSVKEVTAKDPFVFYPLVSLNQLKTSNDLLPNGDLTVQCFIEGHLMLNMTSTNDVIPTKMIKSINIGLCGSKIAQENLKILSKFENDDVIRVYGYRNDFYINRKILYQRVPALSMHRSEWYIANEDFATETEVKDFLSFVVKGEADNLAETCPRLYKVAQKYNFECLMNTCGKIMKMFQ